MDADLACYLGLDVGGTKIAGGLVMFPSAEVIERRKIPASPERGGAAVLEDTLTLAAELEAEARAQRQKIRGVGLGVCELVDISGRIASANSFDWRNLPVLGRLETVGPAVIEADVRAAALAEARFGAGSPFSQFLFITVGTGISCCLVQEGRPFLGARGLTGTMASSPLPALDGDDVGTSPPTLEEIASGPALVTRYNRRASARLASASEVMTAAGRGDGIARDVLRFGATALGAQLGLLISSLDPAAVVIGGGLGTSGGEYWMRLVQATRAHIYSDLQRNLPILPAGLGPDAGWIGAAVAAWNKAVV
ncbi:MAG TPA: ROK family protein [Verrucomicrobiota bacterium]|nr:hypothetical protein [Verrucomicrobiales bacterium]HRI12760.1 ROK family protein [Verrucomicrobiota bacterium]